MVMNRIDAYIQLYYKFIKKNPDLPIGTARIERFLNEVSLSSGEVYDFFVEAAKDLYGE